MLRASQGMTQEEFGRAVKMHRTQISAYETGDKIPRPGTLDRMAAALGTTVKAVVEAAESIRRPAANGISPLDSACSSVTGDRVRKIVEGALLRVAMALQPRARSAEDQRTDAEELWRRLSDLPRDQRLMLAEYSPPFWSPALVERLAEESERVGAERSGRSTRSRRVGPPSGKAVGSSPPLIWPGPPRAWSSSPLFRSGPPLFRSSSPLFQSGSPLVWSRPPRFWSRSPVFGSEPLLF